MEDVVGVFRLEVADSGAGIAEEDRKKVFGEFAQFNRNELQGGGDLICIEFRMKYKCDARRVGVGSVDLQANHRPSQGHFQSIVSLIDLQPSCLW